MNDFPADLEAFIKAERAKVEATSPDLAFTREEYARRRRVLRDGMDKAGIDLLVLMAPDTIAWLHGYECRVYEWHTSTQFPATHATIVHREDDPVLHLDTGLHTELVRRTSCVDEFRPIPATGMSNFSDIDRFLGFLTGELRTEGWGSGVVGIERWSGTPNPAVSAEYERGLRNAGYTVVDATVPIRGARRLKSAEELAMIERAQRAADHGVRTLQRDMRVGMTELQLWELYMRAVVEADGEPSAIHDTIYAGPPEAYGHSLSSRRPIQQGDYIHADVAAAHRHYHARVTRQLYFGTPPAELVRLAEITAGAYDVLTATAEIGMPFGELNRALQRYFRSEGVSDEEGFGGGYELGLSFAPDYVGEFVWGTHDTESEAVIESGFVSNFESCAFLAMIDTVVFEDAGARTLSQIPHKVLTVEA